MDDERKCRNCQFWKPRYHGVGVCEREGRVNAKMWVTEGKELLTVISFSCAEYTQPPAIQDEIL